MLVHPEALVLIFMLLLFQLLLFCVIRVPIAWRKVRGDIEHDFVGYWLDVAKFKVGLPERRARWAADWARSTAARGLVKPEEMTEALGRLGFAAGPLEWLRPYLGPFYAWVAACPRGRNLVLPWMLHLILSWLARMFDGRRLRCCRVRFPPEHGELFRVAAKAEALARGKVEARFSHPLAGPLLSVLQRNRTKMVRIC